MYATTPWHAIIILINQADCTCNFEQDMSFKVCVIKITVSFIDLIIYNLKGKSKFGSYQKGKVKSMFYGDNVYFVQKKRFA